MPITAPYAAVLALMLVVLTHLVVRARAKTTVTLGDGADPRLIEASRCQMNFVENVPMALILMILAEAGGASAMWLNLAGAVLVLARLIHPFGITVKTKDHPLRIAGILATNAVQFGMALLLALQFFA